MPRSNKTNKPEYGPGYGAENDNQPGAHQKKKSLSTRISYKVKMAQERRNKRKRNSPKKPGLY